MGGGRPINVAGMESRYKESNSPVKSGFRRVDDDVMTMWSKGSIIQNELNNIYSKQQRSRETQRKQTQSSLLPGFEQKRRQNRNECLSRGRRECVQSREGKYTGIRTEPKIEKRDESDSGEAREQVRMNGKSDRKRQPQPRDELDDGRGSRNAVDGVEDLNLIEEIFDGIWDAVDALVGDIS